ncbi:retrotransposon protein, putative, ty1-copia subclass [Tanacetum coccineum]|uniref:Retrotransposon protein, putative, ty1-copia subclass n=1 Tax=Tanacetum coccineum TaxID=301880 RepID=A0ABQ4YX35_9ASTR
MGYAHMQAPTYAPKPKNPSTTKKHNPAKDAICHQCGEVSHWRRNCPIYLAELMKKKNYLKELALQGLRGEVRNWSRELNILIYFNAIPWDDIYEIDLSSSNTNDSSMYVVSNKRAKLNLDSTLLWHCRLDTYSETQGELQHDVLLDQ